MTPSPKSTHARKHWDVAANFFIKNSNLKERKEKHRRGAILIQNPMTVIQEEQQETPVLKK